MSCSVKFSPVKAVGSCPGWLGCVQSSSGSLVKSSRVKLCPVESSLVRLSQGSQVELSVVLASSVESSQGSQSFKNQRRQFKWQSRKQQAHR